MLQTVRLDGLGASGIKDDPVLLLIYSKELLPIQLEDKKLLYREVLDNTLEKATI
jgi:hypothetical protein